MSSRSVVVTTDGTSDALVRLLVTVHRRGATVTGAHMVTGSAEAVLQVDVADERASTLLRRLEGLPFVLSAAYAEG